jgi:hypothetical protein
MKSTNVDRLTGAIVCPEVALRQLSDALGDRRPGSPANISMNIEA